MSNLVNKVKDAVSGHSSSGNNQEQGKDQEQSFGILPHPAKSNDPNDLQGDHPKGLEATPEYAAFNTPGPYIPPSNVASNLGPPAVSVSLYSVVREILRRPPFYAEFGRTEGTFS
ncbi:hypothetical protein K474DRAFT_1667774 [Panus rudis PR-1116 ss-1]|nr:hypothetical protein K474DRAFT_1667774 [Panus rudis PR-1116 ss-1]